MNDKPEATERTDEPNSDEALGHSERHWSRREARRARREARAGWGGWIGGAVLIFLGLIFLAQNAGLFFFNNWWALFVLIPAFGSFANALRAYQESGQRLTRQVRGSLVAGTAFLFLTAMLLFSLNWSLLWPVFLILVGVGLLANAYLPED
jgi:hypothetical protein